MISLHRHLVLLLLVVPASLATTIVDIRTNGSDSPFANQVVTVEGVVTAEPDQLDLSGFIIQQPGVSEWGAIQLGGEGTFGRAIPLKIGDRVRATGTVEVTSSKTFLFKSGRNFELRVWAHGRARLGMEGVQVAHLMLRQRLKEISEI